MQGRTGNTAAEDRLVGPVGEGESGTSTGIASTYTIMYKTDSGGSRGITQGAQPGSVDDLEGWDAGRRGGLKRRVIYV